MRYEYCIIDEDSNKTIFDIGYKYEIPIYQRNYAWGKEEIDTLIEDIDGIDIGLPYYLGIVVVSDVKEKNNTYEIIDGQQRLTTLFLLLNCLGYNTEKSLIFSHRNNSTNALKNIDKIIDGYSKIDDFDENIFNMIHHIKEIFNKKDFNQKLFVEKLKQTKIYIIDVPEKTDLNHYFEIMNTRGEQLEEHDIVKSRLMSYLGNDEQARMVFSSIWSACSDMNGYVQSEFVPQIRKQLFGNEYNQIPKDDWKEYHTIPFDKKSEKLSIEKIIDSKLTEEDYEMNIYKSNKEKSQRFHSIITFPYFLIHVLKVFVNLEGIVSVSDEPLIDRIMDDKKLIKIYKIVIQNGVWNGIRIKDDKKKLREFSQKYIICLLRTRYLFDKYIIKTEYINDNSDGEWSLKELQKYRKYNYQPVDTKIKKWDSNIHKNVIMLLSALRVSYTSPKVMHWLTDTLIWLNKNYNTDEITKYDEKLENIMKDAVLATKVLDNDYCQGLDTQHIVFNYLDYLLWKRNQNVKFKFEFRNSVEHFYPRNPHGDELDKWEDNNINDFGNLCLLTTKENSRFSNDPPSAKIIKFDKKIEGFSLKLREMKKIIENYPDNKDKKWKDNGYAIHRDAMLTLLEENCKSRRNVVDNCEKV